MEPGKLDQAGFAMHALKKAMQWDEAVFGLELDLERFMIVAVGDFNMGAMENKGLNIFNTKYVLARPDTATDEDYYVIDKVVAHEYFHNWTGNRVTCRDWFQLSLKEGLTVFRDQEYSADEYSRAVARIQDVRDLRARQFPEDAGPMAHPVRPDSYVEINNFYTATVYDKGAEVVRMIHTIIGKEDFRRGMDLYFERHDGQAVTCDDFAQAMEDASGVELAQFRRWYSQAGTPVVECRGEYDEAAKTYTLHVTPVVRADARPAGEAAVPSSRSPSASSAPTARDMPLRLRGRGRERCGYHARARRARGGAALRLRRRSGAARAVAACAASPRRCVLRFEAHRRGPHAPDGARQRRLQPLGGRPGARHAHPARGRRGDPRAASPMEVPAAFVEAIGRVLANASRDPAFAAECLALPPEAFLAEQMDVADPDAIHEARKRLRRELAERYRTRFEGAFRHFTVTGPYSPDAAAAGRRALRNAALGYLMAIDDSTARALTFLEYRRAENMTDAMAALECLANSAGAERERALGMFYEKWKDEALVVDKWFRVQATSGLPGTLERVKALHGPSRVRPEEPEPRALAAARLRHGQPGALPRRRRRGYRFVAEQVVALDRINPQIASRLARAFDRWKKYDAGRQAHARAALESIRAAADAVERRGRGRGRARSPEVGESPGNEKGPRKRPFSCGDCRARSVLLDRLEHLEDGPRARP